MSNEPTTALPVTGREHTAPLRWLVKTKLHGGRTLRENVIRLRWKRRKPATQEAALVVNPPQPEAKP